jgi:predicted acyltransferase
VTDRLAPPSPGRIASLDQFRGYTVAGMLLVNFIGGFAVVPAILKHHNTYCSYADTIMPQFFFAVGFAYRLTFLRRLGTVGARAASLAVIRRCAGLALVGFAVYHLDGGVKSWSESQALGVGGFLKTAFQRDYFQTLVHIAVTSVWVLPVIGARAAVRVAYIAASAALHILLSKWFFFDWALHRPVIDGGQIGFLTWTAPLLVGSLAYDAVARGGTGWRVVTRLLGWSGLIMLVGYGMSCLGGNLAAPPFVAPPTSSINLWTMSQRTGSVSYLVFGAGFSLAVYAVFLALCDPPGRRGLDIGIFRSFGRNALVAYVVHGMVAGGVKAYLPGDAPGWYVASGFSIFFLINYLFVRGLEKDSVYVRL